MNAQNHASQLARSERDQHTTADLYPMTQRFGQQVREGLIEGNGETDVAICGQIVG